MEEMSPDELRVLARGFRGPRPGSNAFPLLEIRDLGVKISGERIDALIRAKHLIGTPVAGAVQVIKGGNAGPFGEIPDVELSYSYRLNSGYFPART